MTPDSVCLVYSSTNDSVVSDHKAAADIMSEVGHITANHVCDIERAQVCQKQQSGIFCKAYLVIIQKSASLSLSCNAVTFEGTQNKLIPALLYL